MSKSPQNPPQGSDVRSPLNGSSLRGGSGARPATSGTETDREVAKATHQPSTDDTAVYGDVSKANLHYGSRTFVDVELSDEPRPSAGLRVDAVDTDAIERTSNGDGKGAESTSASAGGPPELGAAISERNSAPLYKTERPAGSGTASRTSAGANSRQETGEFAAQTGYGIGDAINPVDSRGSVGGSPNSDANVAPTDITYVGGTVDENAAVGTVVATLGTVDPDAGDSHTYAITNDPSGLFEIAGNEVKVKSGARVNFEAAAAHDITIETTDSGGNTYSEVITLDVNDVNEAPTDILPNVLSVDENATAGTIIGALSAADEDAGERFRFRILDDPSGNFRITTGKGAGRLAVARGATLDHEQADSHDVLLEVRDSAGNTYQESVTINVNDVNEAPNDITHSGGTVDENAVAGAVVATLNTVDPDAGDNHTYAITNDPSRLFEIVGNEVRVKSGARVDYETAAVHNITVETTDSGGNTFHKDVVITVNDRSEITGTVAGDWLRGTLAGEDILGLGGNDRIRGRGGDDRLFGGDGADNLRGGSGDDLIAGGRGNDVLAGGRGDDLFLFHEGDGSDRANGGAGARWTDTLQLKDAAGGDNIGEFGTDWTVTISSGSIESQDTDSIALAQDTDGTVTLQDGSEIRFTNLERIEW